MGLTKAEEIELIRLLEEEEKAKAKTNYLNYARYTNKDFVDLRHSLFLCDTINTALITRDKMLKGEIPQGNQYIMISMPPRHGKSMSVTETLPSYFMCRYPMSKVILTAYSSTLANDFSRSNSKKIEEYKLFNVKVATDNQDRTHYTNGSECIKAGILGGITGKGAHLMIIDDPIKTAEEARSEVQREKIWKEWISSLSTRIEPPAIIILIMTRWHEDDLAGRLLNNEYAKPLPWKVINLPLEAEKNDVLGRAEGEPLWIDRYGYDFIKERKQYPESFNALYQGRPTSEEGNIFKREAWQYYDYSKAFIDSLPVLVMSVDASFKDTVTSAKCSIQVWGKKGANYYKVDNNTALMGFTATIQAMKNMLAKYPRIGAKYIEDKANGSAIIEVLNKQIGGFIPVKADAGTGGKVARAHAVEPFVTSGNVFLPRGQTWVHDYVEEMASFPNGTYADQCFIAGTKIATICGDKNIEDIKAGYRVITPYGIRLVSNAWCTGEREVITVNGITGTKNHPIFTYENGFVNMDTLTQTLHNDILSLGGVIKWRYKRLLSLMEKDTNAWEGRESITLLCEKILKRENVLKDFMWQFGNFIISKKYKKAMRFTIKMAILLITTLATWNVYQGWNIAKQLNLKTLMHKQNILKALETKLKNGIKVKKAENGTVNIGKTQSVKLKVKNIYANIVTKNMKVKTHIQDSAHTNVMSIGDTTTKKQRLIKNASCVEISSKQEQLIATKLEEQLVVDNVEQRCNGRKEKVYNLTVEKDHVYYANGLLVSNCDASTQILHKLIYYYAEMQNKQSNDNDFFGKRQRETTKAFIDESVNEWG
jgi:predicted phage terminase large subunit-like protein